MDYPKVLYKGKHYTDYAQMGRDVHANVIEKRLVADDIEQAAAENEGFGPLGDLIDPLDEHIGTQTAPVIEPMKRRGRPPKHDPA